MLFRSDHLGVNTAGLEYRVKSRESHLRKIVANYRPDGTTYEVKDILRYTYTAEPNNLVQKTLASIDGFAKDGYDTVEVKNTWLNPLSPYKGINTTIRASNGQKFELQYHTPQSFALKDGDLHRLYEEWRLLPNKASEEAVELSKRMQFLSSQLQVPTGIEKVR